MQSALRDDRIHRSSLFFLVASECPIVESGRLSGEIGAARGAAKTIQNNPRNPVSRSYTAFRASGIQRRPCITWACLINRVENGLPCDEGPKREREKELRPPPPAASSPSLTFTPHSGEHYA